MKLHTTWSRAALLATTLGAVAALGISGCSSSSNSTIPITTPFVTVTPTVNLGLWVANGTNVLEFTPSETTTAGVSDPIPTLQNNSVSFTSPQGVQFDGGENLWVVDGGDNGKAPALFEFSNAQVNSLGTDDNPVPNITITSSSFEFPQQAVFDGNGNLWVSDNAAGAVFVFSAAQLAIGGSLTPSISLESEFDGPLGIAFDPTTGNLFVANNSSTTIFEFNAAHLPALNSGTVQLAPDAVLSTNSSESIAGPWGLAFDTSGDLFSSNAGLSDDTPNTVVEFAHAVTATTGTPNPVLTLSPATDGSATTLSAPNGIALDNLGDLAAISSALPFGIPIYGSGQLSTSGPIVPDFLLVGASTTLNAPAGCTFGPVIP